MAMIHDFVVAEVKDDYILHYEDINGTRDILNETTLRQLFDVSVKTSNSHEHIIMSIWVTIIQKERIVLGNKGEVPLATVCVEPNGRVTCDVQIYQINDRWSKSNLDWVRCALEQCVPMLQIMLCHIVGARKVSVRNYDAPKGQEFQKLTAKEFLETRSSVDIQTLLTLLEFSFSRDKTGNYIFSPSFRSRDYLLLWTQEMENYKKREPKAPSVEDILKFAVGPQHESEIPVHVRNITKGKESPKFCFVFTLIKSLRQLIAHQNHLLLNDNNPGKYFRSKYALLFFVGLFQDLLRSFEQHLLLSSVPGMVELVEPYRIMYQHLELLKADFCEFTDAKQKQYGLARNEQRIETKEQKIEDAVLTLRKLEALIRSGDESAIFYSQVVINSRFK